MCKKHLGEIKMKILVINCSPVKNGATAQIVRLVSEFCGKGNEVRSVCIGDYEIKLCRVCRKCHETAECSISDDTKKLMAEYEWADKIVSVSPSYWADIPGQFKVFIDRCTPWCNTHEPHAKISGGKKRLHNRAQNRSFNAGMRKNNRQHRAFLRSSRNQSKRKTRTLQS